MAASLLFDKQNCERRKNDVIVSPSVVGGSLSESRAFWAIYISVAISYLGVGLVAPLIAIVLSEHHANPFVIGLVGTTMFAAFTAASFPVGWLTDRVGPKPILVGGLIVYGVSIILFAMIREIELFFIARAIEGVGAAAISVATETMISRLSSPNERAQRMSYYALSVGAGWAAGPMAGTLLFGIRPEAPFVACFALSLLAAVLASGFIPAAITSTHHTAELPRKLSLKIFVPISAGALYGYLMSSLVTLFPLYLKEHLSIAETEMGGIITAVIVGTILSQVPIGRAADRFGKRRTLLICAVLLAVDFFVMTLHSDWRYFLISGAFAGALAGSFYPLGLAMIGGLVSKERLGAATSLFSLAFGIGSLTGPGLSGLAMSELENPKWLFYLPVLLTTVFSLVMVALYGKTAARKNRAA
ncbi:MAG TPA: MFS transporter [Blastocatellia bacterium]|nr:MFS transporter [Blastocatellia bacterium]